MTFSTPTPTTIQVKLSKDSRTPIEMILTMGVSGDWTIGRSHNVSQFTTLEVWDEGTESVYITPIVQLVRVYVDKNNQDRYVINFNRHDVTQVSMDFSQKGFRFPGHGVRLSN